MKTKKQRLLNELNQALFVDKNKEKAIELFASIKAVCEGSGNGYCQTELFCPECPFGEFPVQNAKFGL